MANDFRDDDDADMGADAASMFVRADINKKPNPSRSLGRARPAPIALGRVRPAQAPIALGRVQQRSREMAITSPSRALPQAQIQRPSPRRIEGISSLAPAASRPGPRAKVSLDAEATPMAQRPVTPAMDPYTQDAVWEPFNEPAAGNGDPFEVSPAMPSAFQPFAEKELTPMGVSSTRALNIVGTPKPVDLGWFDRVLGWFGVARHKVVQATIAGEGASMAVMSRSEAAQQVVRRARNGDQNAMGMIAEVRKAAIGGMPQAIMSAKLMRQYIDTHPVSAETLEMGYGDMKPRTPSASAKPVDPSETRAITLSHGPKLTDASVLSALRAAGFGAEEYHSFKHGYAGRKMRNPDKRVQAANAFGKIVAKARKLQAVREPNSRVSDYSPIIGWELGED